MKFRIYLTENTKGIPYNYAYELSCILHKWLVSNTMYDEMSLCSLGWLSGPQVEQHPETPQQRRQGALFFRGGARWDIGLYDETAAAELIKSLPERNMDFYGMQIQGSEVLSSPRAHFDTGSHRFLANSPVLIRRLEENGSYTHVTFRSRESGQLLTEHMRQKAEIAGFPITKELKLFFDPNFRNAKTRLIDIKGIKIKASVCPIIAYGQPEVLEFVWTVGAGELCGLGFGSLDHTAR